jgi:hypothetical protein
MDWGSSTAIRYGCRTRLSRTGFVNGSDDTIIDTNGWKLVKMPNVIEFQV